MVDLGIARSTERARIETFCAAGCRRQFFGIARSTERARIETTLPMNSVSRFVGIARSTERARIETSIAVARRSKATVSPALLSGRGLKRPVGRACRIR